MEIQQLPQPQQTNIDYQFKIVKEEIDLDSGNETEIMLYSEVKEEVDEQEVTNEAENEKNVDFDFIKKENDTNQNEELNFDSLIFGSDHLTMDNQQQNLCVNIKKEIPSDNGNKNENIGYNGLTEKVDEKEISYEGEEEKNIEFEFIKTEIDWDQSVEFDSESSTACPVSQQFVYAKNVNYSTHTLKLLGSYSDSSDQEIKCSSLTPSAVLTYITDNIEGVFQETIYSEHKSKLQNIEHNKNFIHEQDKDASKSLSPNCNMYSQNIDSHNIEIDSDKDPKYVLDSNDIDLESEACTSSQNYARPVERDTQSSNSLVCKKKLHKVGDVEGSSEMNNTLKTKSETFKSIYIIKSCKTDIDSKENTIFHLDRDIDKPKRVRRKDFCFYCKTLVTTFARHIYRNHRYEFEVQKINSKHNNSKERKDLIALLRKKGNYLYSATNEAKPVRTPSLPNTSSSILPCSYCLGFYSKRLLWRHRKICSQNPGRDSKESSQVAGQCCLLRDVNVNSKIYKQVFPRMRADEISLTAKKDPLIRFYGSCFLSTHKNKHQINFISRKMRELAKLLNAVRRIKPRISSLLQALKPEHFDVLVEAAKVAASYDVESDTYNAPTYAMNISRSLKECCEIGISVALKKKDCFGEEFAAEVKAELQRTMLLLKSNWKFEVSHQAATNHNLANSEGVKNKRNTLDELEVNLGEDLQCSYSEQNNKGRSDDEYRNLLLVRDVTEENMPSAESENRKNSRDSKKPKKREFTKWTQEEKNTVFNFFKTHIERCKPPRKYECEKLMSQYPILFKNKTWPKIKVLVQNIYTQKTRIKQD